MYSMNYIGKFISNFRDFYNEINAATLTGAIDVIVVEQDDGSFTCSPFHVRFGKLGVLRSREKVVDIEINGEPRQIHMKLGDSGEAFFVEEVSSHGLENGTEIPPHLACSPIPDDNCFPPPRFHLLSDLPQEQHEKILRDSVLSIEREKLEQMSSLPVDQREKFLIEQFSDLPAEHREKWLQIASMTYEERSKIFEESLSAMSTRQKQQMIRDEYSALKIEDRERLFKENFPELPAEQRPKFEKALLNDWRRKEDDDEDEEKWKELNEITSQAEEEIFNMDNINEDEVKPVSTPKSFVAVTSSERIRKISVVNNDFRPITDDPSNNVREKISCDESSKVDKKSHVDEIVDEVKVQSSSSSKRKRRKKSIMKKKGAQRKASNGSSSQTEVSETETTQPTEESLSEPVLKSASPIVENETKATEDLPPQSDYHFFSDTEITKNRDSRPCSPVQSDTEFEMRKIEQQREEVKEREDDKSHQQSWRWGELPSPPLETSHPLNSATTVIQPNDEAQRSMLSGMFSFMKKTSRVRHNPESEGIYLSDLNADELDPEVAALYFPSSHRGTTVAKEGKQVDEEDTESGNGPSLPQSPNSVEGAIGGPKSLDSDFEESKQSLFDNNIDISLSLCGGLDIENGPIDESFQQNLLHYDDLCNDTKLYENPNLVVKINGKYYNWTTACPIIMSLVAFQRGLPQHTIENLYAQSGSLPIHQDNKKEIANKTNEARSGYSSWFSWRRSSTQPPKKISDAIGQDGHDIPIENNQANESPESAIDIEEVDSPSADQEKNEVEEQQVMLETKDLDENSLNNLEGNLTAQSSVEQTNERPEGEGYSGSEDSDSNPNETQGVRIPERRRPYYESGEKYRKTLRLTSEQIKSLNLKEGPNEVVFSVTTAYQGTSRCKCHIYRWKWNDKIVISDIDGTITKSDVLGHILPIVGKDWAQSGVAQLFTKIKNNGYKLLYLSARAIGQARGTRQYLKSIKQDDLSLPEGPLLLNPTSLLSAFHREVIEKKPEQFKISCLSDIQALFPDGSNPFYAGYGNRINDVWAYRAVGIPITRIFTINHRGELKHELTQTFQSSYSNMSYIVDHLFPALRDASDEFSHFSYWRDPIPELPNLDDLLIENQSTQ
ncbi:phosphatidate phosphatase LPIN2 isoform X2 [Microplitis mediator]|uniref:phosphatidate phosphatase LPIN2 isoform X2 n=1 Tax=Microplitis mediator TaxID=375433 RepID=UPI00255480CE|nr:phosphatidate phosphatase LPIN2 isoform X2 [Microplitis mediator]